MTRIGLTVTDSQVFGWMQLLNQQGYPTSIISMVNELNTDLDMESITKKTGGKYFQYRNKIPFLGNLFFFFKFLNHYLAARKNSEKVIFQTRTSGAAIPLIVLKILTRVKIVYDARGATIEESIYGRNEKKLNLKKAYKFKLLQLREALLIKYSDHVFCVSDTLKQYYLFKYHNISDNKFSVVPCAADQADFYYDKSERDSMRDKFNLKGKKVLLYSGRLDKKWDIPEEIFDFYQQLSNSIENLVLFLLTPDREIAENLVIRHQLSESEVYITAASYKDVRKYLNMVDYGLLLRENAVMNHVSSPTKFAEYMHCGLPVLISDTVYDYANLIEKTGFGTVINNYKLNEEKINQIRKIENLSRKEIANWSLKNLDKQSYIKGIVEIFKTI